jgi:uncharacterized protein YbjQ (UPF0145 family)
VKLYTNTLPDVVPLKMLTASATYGMGFLTSVVKVFCEFFGVKCDMYTNKLDKAEDKATEYLMLYAKDIGADGVMDVRCQIDGLTFFICGTAYKEKIQTE